jgi:hypothetical protein
MTKVICAVAMTRAIFTIAIAFLCIAAANRAFRDFSSLRTHSAAYRLRHLYVSVAHIIYSGNDETEFSKKLKFS